MESQAKLRKHADLLDRMGQSLGLDLEQAALTGALPFDEISEAVLRCTCCAHPGKCASRLAAGCETGVQAGAPPEYCQNRDLLSALQAQPV